jgi:hypothetical protein
LAIADSLSAGFFQEIACMIDIRKKLKLLIVLIVEKIIRLPSEEFL